MLYYNHVLKKDLSIDDIFENINNIDRSNIFTYNKYSRNHIIESVEQLLEEIKLKFIECNKIIINHLENSNERYAAFILTLKNMPEFELIINNFSFDGKNEGYYPIEGQVGTISGSFNVSKTFIKN